MTLSMNSIELLDLKEQLRKKAEVIISTAEKEIRQLNGGEEAELKKIKGDIKAVDADLEKITNKRNYQTNNTNNMKKFSLLKTINDAVNNRSFSEESQEVINAGMEEMRKAGQSYSGSIVLPMEYRTDPDPSIQAQVATYGQENVAEDKLGILEPLRKKLVLVQAGAYYMTGLVGNVSIPVYSGSNVGWAGEVDTASNGKGSFSEVALEPKRLTAFIDVSKQFLIQDSNSAEEMLKRDIIAALAEKLETTILGTEAGSTTKPAGMLNGVTADTADITYKQIVGMESTLEDRKSVV